MLTQIRDGIRNVVTRLGTDKDKGAQNQHYFQELTDSAIVTAYHGSWLARQIVDIPADDATRKWREWIGDQADEMAAYEKEWRVSAKVHDAARRARLFGGSAILIGAGPESLAEPFDPKTVQRDELKYLTVLDRQDLNPGEMELDPTEPLFGRPKHYQLNTLNGLNADVHPSRLAIFRGHRRAERASSSNTTLYSSGWDLSVLQVALEAIQHADGSIASLSSLVADARLETLKIEDLQNKLALPEFEDLLVKRMEAARMLKSIYRREAIDATENLETSTYGFSGMGDVIDRFAMVVCGAADIPMTRLYGQSPGGLNSTGEGDLANYYDQIASRQENEIGPSIAGLDEVLLRSKFGEPPEGLRAAWRPLRQMTELQRAEVLSKKATAFSSVAATAVFDEMEIDPGSTEWLTELGFQQDINQGTDDE